MWHFFRFLIAVSCVCMCVCMLLACHAMPKYERMFGVWFFCFSKVLLVRFRCCCFFFLTISAVDLHLQAIKFVWRKDRWLVGLVWFYNISDRFGIDRRQLIIISATETMHSLNRVEFKRKLI